LFIFKFAYLILKVLIHLNRKLVKMNRNEILALLVADLREKLKELGIQSSGRKVELQNRLLAHYGLENEEENDQNSVHEENEATFVSVSENTSGQNNAEDVLRMKLEADNSSLVVDRWKIRHSLNHGLH